MKKVMSYCMFIVPLLLGAVLVWIDTADYRTTLGGLDRDSTWVTTIEGIAEGLSNDMVRVNNCRRAKENTEIEADKNALGYRACLIEAMQGVETTEGAMIATTEAASWLSKHATDADFREAAVKAINTGRAKLVAAMPMLNRQTKAYEAHDRSVVMKLLEGKKDSLPSHFNFLASSLDTIEYEIMLPSVARKQREWRLKAVVENRSTPG